MSDERTSVSENTSNLDLTHLRELLLVEGKHVPSGKDLVEEIKKVNLREEFKGVNLLGAEDGRLNLQFSSLNQARLFMLNIAAKGHEQEVFYFFGHESLFEPKLLKDTRLDSGQFSYSEFGENGHIRMLLFVKYSKDYGERIVKYDNLVKGVISETMANLKEAIKDFTFLGG